MGNRNILISPSNPSQQYLLYSLRNPILKECMMNYSSTKLERARLITEILSFSIPDYRQAYIG